METEDHPVAHFPSMAGSTARGHHREQITTMMIRIGTTPPPIHVIFHLQEQGLG